MCNAGGAVAVLDAAAMRPLLFPFFELYSSVISVTSLSVRFQKTADTDRSYVVKFSDVCARTCANSSVMCSPSFSMILSIITKKRLVHKKINY
jgi:hypothetical protein